MNLVQAEHNPAKKLVGIAAVVVFHLLLLWALVSGLATKVVDAVKAPVVATIIPPVKPPPPPKLTPPPPQKLLPPPPAYVPPPEVVVRQAPPPTVVAAVTAKPAPVPPPTPTPVAAAPAPAPAPKADVRTPAVIDAAKNCTKPEYPALSERREEEGTVTLRFTIDVSGHVTNADIANSSGYPRLDDAARDALSKCLFKPGMLNGTPQTSQAFLKYAWHLQ